MLFAYDLCFGKTHFACKRIFMILGWGGGHSSILEENALIRKMFNLYIMYHIVMKLHCTPICLFSLINKNGIQDGHQK